MTELRPIYIPVGQYSNHRPSSLQWYNTLSLSCRPATGNPDTARPYPRYPRQRRPFCRLPADEPVPVSLEAPAKTVSYSGQLNYTSYPLVHPPATPGTSVRCIPHEGMVLLAVTTPPNQASDVPGDKRRA